MRKITAATTFVLVTMAVFAVTTSAYAAVTLVSPALPVIDTDHVTCIVLNASRRSVEVDLT